MTHKLSNIIAILVIATLLVQFIQSASPEKSYLLQANFKEGDSETIIYKLESSADIRVPSFPEHPVIPLYSRLEQVIEQKILGITGTGISRLERTYSSSKYYIGKKSSSAKTDSLDGKKIIIEPDGSITPTKSIEPKIQEFISINEHRFYPILPKSEIQLQSEWTVPSKTVTAIFNFSNQKKGISMHGCTEIGINARFINGSLKCTLKQIKKDIAVIEMVLALKGDENGSNLDTALKGMALFDMAKGRFTTVELSGDLNLEDNLPCAKGGKDKVIGKGTINIAYEFK
jgi:hypothetical protein